MTLLHECLHVGTECVPVLLGNSYLMSSVPVSSTECVRALLGNSYLMSSVPVSSTLAVNSSLTRLL